MANEEVRRDVAFLLWRAGFGAPPEEIERGARLGYPGLVDRLLAFPDVPARPGRTPKDLRAWWVERMRAATLEGTHGSWSLQEKLTLFWHGHFTSSLDAVDDDPGNRIMLAQNEIFRTLGGGIFADLLAAVARDPAILVYLNNDANVAGAGNENWGRELLELFTLGIGNYTEADVKACARAFTGWGVTDDGVHFAFDREEHDSGPKTFLGVTGPLDGTDIIRLVATPGSPGFAATARNICGRLYRFFATSTPTPADLAPLIAAFIRSGGSIRDTVRALFLSPSFRGEESRAAHVRSPVEYTVGIARSLGVSLGADETVAYLDAQGQSLLYPPNVGGWPGGTAWVSTGSMIARFSLAGEYAQALDAARLVRKREPATWDDLIEAVIHRLALDLRPQTRRAILDMIGPTPPERDDGRIALLAQLLLITPEMLVS